MNKIYYFLFALLPLFLMASCSDDDDNGSTCTYINQNAQGTILGANWQFREGEASLDGTEYQLYLYSTAETAISEICNVSALSLTGTQITFFVDNQIGEYALSGINQVTLYNATSTNFAVVNSGCISVEAISTSGITGKINIDQNGHTISGNFSATICP